MVEYRIVCTTQEPEGRSHDAAHIVLVGVGDNPDHAQQLLALKDVFKRMVEGHSFYTKSPSAGTKADVHQYNCKTCNKTTIRSSADAVLDNNLDSLRSCRI